MPLNIVGTAGADSILGSGGPDSIDGGAGDDTISGNIFGPDTLAGGAGADLFLFVGQSEPREPPNIDTIVDWEPQDRIVFSQGLIPLTYREATASDYLAARSLSSLPIARGEVNFLVVQAGPDLYVFVDAFDDNSVHSAIRIANRTLADIDVSNFVGLYPDQIPPALPAAPSAGVGGAGVSVAGNMDLIHPADLLSAVIVDADEFGLELANASLHVIAQGTDFTYVDNQLVGGTVLSLSYAFGQDTATPMSFSVQGGAGFPAALLTQWVLADDAVGALSTLLAGNDGISGRLTNAVSRQVPGDLIRGFAGNDRIYGEGGADTLFGGQGDDVIYANEPRNFTTPWITASTYLRGEEGNDYIVGGIGFDDINGNMGNDTCSGSDGDDWVVGGKDDDLLFGDAGGDIVYGNLGNDTCAGGQGNDLIRGGQANDTLYGEAGDDWLSGDRGADTISGGRGADIFHTSSGAGIDRVTDFNLAEGDRVQVDPGTTWTVTQVGADTVIEMGNGDQMILVGVQASTLTGSWIFGA